MTTFATVGGIAALVDGRSRHRCLVRWASSRRWRFGRFWRAHVGGRRGDHRVRHHGGKGPTSQIAQGWKDLVAEAKKDFTDIAKPFDEVHQ